MNRRRPQDLVFTLFGDYLLHRPGPVWAGSLVVLLETLGLKRGTSRTVLSRMARRGWLVSRRRGRRSEYDLTARGRRLLEEGEERIHHPPRDEAWMGTWRLISYSIPEELRSQRDRMRIRLSWLGCGSLGNGLWITPHDVGARLAEMAGGLRVAEYVELFEARHVGFSDTAHLVTQCWDLAGIAKRYRAFLTRNRPAFERCPERLSAGRWTPRDCFMRRFRLIHEYRQFPLMDPYLPRELLPADWPGEAAAELFRSYHALLAEPAERYVAQVCEEEVAVVVSPQP